MSQTAEKSATDFKQKAQFFSDVTDIWSLGKFLGRREEKEQEWREALNSISSLPVANF